MKLNAIGVAALMAAVMTACSKPEPAAPAAPPAPPPPPSVALVPAAQQSPRFDAVNRHLELGGLLYGYVDIDGDVEHVADLAQKMIAELAPQVPQLAQVKDADIKALVRTLGLTDLSAVGVSSVREPNGEFRNRAFLATPNGRHGLLAVPGGPSGPFEHVDLAPADADVYEEIEFDAPALASAIKQVMIKIQGPEAEAKIENAVKMGGMAASVSPLDLVHHLKGKLTLVLRVDPNKTITLPGAKPVVVPAFAVLVGIDGIGPDLQPLLDKSPFLDHRSEGTSQFYTPKVAMMMEGIRPILAISGSTLYFSSSEFFLHDCLGRAPHAGLSQNAEFQRLLQELGPEGNTVAYVSPRFYQQLKRLPELNSEMDPSMRRILNAVLTFQPPMTRAVMTLTQNLPDGILLKGRMNQSLKPQLAALAIYNPGFALGMFLAAQQQKQLAALTAPGAAPGAAAMPAKRKPLRIYWTDVEGGGSTLIVTPAGQSILIDSGNPGTRDSGRIRRTATLAGVRQIDFYITTHFHIDHFGGAAELSTLIPIRQVFDNGIPEHDPDHHPSDALWMQTSRPYREFTAGSRHVVRAGLVLPLRQAPGLPVRLRCVASRQHFVPAPAGAEPNPLADENTSKQLDPTDNDNSSAWVLDYGPFRFWDGGDLTWNMEAKMVLPVNRVGQVDVYQVDHHGLDVSNNPVLIHSLAPSVSVMNNGITKGTTHSAVEALKSSPGIQAMYQLHKNLRPADPEDNTSDGYIANLASDPNHRDAHYIELSVDPSGKSYIISIPERHIFHIYTTRLDKR